MIYYRKLWGYTMLGFKDFILEVGNEPADIQWTKKVKNYLEVFK